VTITNWLKAGAMIASGFALSALAVILAGGF